MFILYIGIFLFRNEMLAIDFNKRLIGIAFFILKLNNKLIKLNFHLKNYL